MNDNKQGVSACVLPRSTLSQLSNFKIRLNYIKFADLLIQKL